jgi:hypothetical protein
LWEVALKKRDTGVNILVTPHDIVLGAGTKFVSHLVDAGTTLVTRGLAASGRSELALVLLRAPAAFPNDRAVASALDAMTAFLREMAELAMAGTPMSEGHTMSLANGLVKPHLRGMVWVKPVPFVNDPSVPPNALVGVPLFLDELKLARDTAPYRVLARLGMEYREFPFPPWLDAMRASVSQLEAEQSSLLSGISRVKTDVSFLAEHAEGNPRPEHLVRLSLRVRARAREPLMRAFATTPDLQGAVAFVGMPDDEANTLLLWQPAQKGFRAVEAPGSDFTKITGAFFAIVPDEEFKLDRALMMEDGYTLFPTIASWTRLHAALASGAPLTLPLEHGHFELVWDAT